MGAYDNANLPDPVDANADKNGNEISQAGKFWAGFLLIFFTLFSALYLIGHWPDKLVASGATIKPLYTYCWFHVKLVGIPDTEAYSTNDIVSDKPAAGNGARADTIPLPDTLKDQSKIDIIKKANAAIKATANQIKNDQPVTVKKDFPPEKDLMHINTLLLILVAVAGFLGNMIYIATSFTTFIGNEKFKKSWTMWYFVKPFTAAGLAIAVYFVFRGGFLNMSDDSSNINLYGLMTISILAGLFTDRTTLKLKEVFDVLLRPKEERNDTLAEGKPEVTTATAAAELEVGKPVLVTVTGKNLDKGALAIKIEGSAIANLNRQPSTITFNYTLPPELKDKAAVTLQVSDDKGNAVGSPAQLAVKKSGGNGGQTPVNGDAASIISVELKLGDAFAKQEEAQDITAEDFKQATVTLTPKEGDAITLTNVATDASGKTFSASNIKYGSYTLKASVLGEHYEADTNGRTVIQLDASSDVEIKETAVSFTLMLEMNQSDT